MAKIETILDDMRAHLKSANFEALAALTPSLETAMQALADLPPDELEQIRKRAETNATLLQAARRGVIAARRRLDEVRRAGSGLQTYDIKGKRATLNPGGTTAGRF
jgi:hypothetical protein